MSAHSFFGAGTALSVADVATMAGVAQPPDAPDLRIAGVASLEEAGPSDLCYMDSPRYVTELTATRAGLCLVSRRFAPAVPANTIPLVVTHPQQVYAAVLARLYPAALMPAATFGATGVNPGSTIHPTARLEADVTVDPGAVVGPDVEIGRGTVIGAGSVIGAGVRIGRGCAIGPQVTVIHAYLGNRVIVHPGARLGQDGFGFVFERGRHAKVPQIGRVIVQDDVEIGANTTIDRGATRDTVIGEGTKIDNQVQIAHNVVIGRHCIIVAQTGISGSTTLEDYVVIAGQVGVIGHIRIGQGAQIAASSNVRDDVPAGGRYGGTPAKPVRDWFREMTTLKKLASRAVTAKDGGGDEP